MYKERNNKKIINIKAIFFTILIGFLICLAPNVKAYWVTYDYTNTGKNAITYDTAGFYNTGFYIDWSKNFEIKTTFRLNEYPKDLGIYVLPPAICDSNIHAERI